MRLEGLENISFKTITPATPFHDQVKIWNDADIVVSVHGSQLTNAFFMAPHSAFVEIFMPFYHNDDLAKLAKMAQIKHVKLLSDKLVDKATVKAEQPAKLAAWHHMQRVMHKYPNFRSCHRHSACRDGARQIGALADPLAFREAISHILDGMLGRGDCVPGP